MKREGVIVFSLLREGMKKKRKRKEEKRRGMRGERAFYEWEKKRSSINEIC